MLKRPDLYPMPIPEPAFGIRKFLTGRGPFLGEPRPPRMPLRPGGPLPPGPPRPQGPPNAVVGPRPAGPPPQGPLPPPRSFELRWLLVRLTVALGLAALVGAWLGKRFTTPLTQLADGATAFRTGQFAHRIPSSGKNEFASVADAMNEMAARVSEQIDKLEKDAQRRRQFLADIAHELRSPVATMRTMAGALQDGVAEEPERRERAISSLARTSERLQRLIEDLMELAKLDLNELPLNKRDVDLRELVESALHSHEAEAAAADVVLLPLAPGAPVRLTIDPDRMTQVLDNLIGNAVSYAGRGAEVRVTIDGGDPVSVTVRDTGSGIWPDELPYIFDPFYRSDRARNPGDPHSGLGLSIARKLVEAYGGEMRLSSEEGKGTTVTVLLPVPR